MIDMPFRSEKQRRYMWSQHPEIAKAWAHGKHTKPAKHKKRAKPNSKGFY